jgi:apolipoprotein D and lipocalin family protein
MKSALLAGALLITALLVASCQNTRQAPLETVARVDVQRFMGDWYVIANIPTLLERGAHNAVESYALDKDGSIATTFTFRADSFDGKPKKMTPRGFIRDRNTNALWDMQFIWPFKSDYRIIYLSDDYSQTVIGRQKRDYVWIMARTPSIAEDDYRNILALLARQGYDIARIERVPQSWAPRP